MPFPDNHGLAAIKGCSEACITTLCCSDLPDHEAIAKDAAPIEQGFENDPY